MNCSGWCLPLIIYIVLSVLALAGILSMSTHVTADGTVVHIPMSVRLQYFVVALVFYTLIAWLMYFLCSRCHAGWSWFILLLPFILAAIIAVAMFAGIVHVANSATRPVPRPLVY